MDYTNRFLWILSIVLLSEIASAEPASSKTVPVHIKADEITFEKELNKATAAGHVLITKDTSILRAEKVEAYFSKGEKSQKINLIKAFKNVKVQTPDYEATGDQGVYDIQREEIVLEGNVTVNDHKNIVHGAYGVMNQKTGVTRVLSQNPKDPNPKQYSQVSAFLVSSE